MASNTKRTARGDYVNMDTLRLANETVIAVGNAKQNARGDLLGPGGKVVKSRAEIMKDYHKINTAVAEDTPVAESASRASLSPSAPEPNTKTNLGDELVEETPTVETTLAQPMAEDTPVAESAYKKPRGSFADSVAKATEVNQELLDPSSVVGNSDDGIKRI